MPQSPAEGSEGVVRVTVFSDGQAIASTVQLISIVVSRTVNMIPAAQIVLQDGDMANKSFEVSDAATFKPGAAIKINAGYDDVEETIFEGIVVKHSVKITGDNHSRLLIDCRDKAVCMTVGRKNAAYIDKTDSGIISSLISAGGLTADVESTDIQYKELVQYYCSDWDFALTRADTNGLLVVVVDGTVKVKSPQTSASPTLKVTYGTDLMEFHADIDARTQWAAAQGFSWDLKTQAILQGDEASPPTLNAQGDLDGAELAKVAGLSSYRLQSGAPLTKPELKAWAKAHQLKAGLARVRGRMKFQGSGKAKVGELIEVEGVGARFSGKVFVSSVNHEIAAGNWITEVEFGVSPAWFSERTDVMAPPASGLLPGAEGLYIGVVAKLDGDPDGENKIQVTVPVLGADAAGVWARLISSYGSNGFGAFFVPEIGDEVVLGYFNNDPSHPVILGSLYSSKHAPPYALAAENNIKAIVTRCKSKIELNEEDKVITVTTPGNNKIVLSDKDKSILLQDQNQNKVELNSSGITLDSPKNIQINAKGTISLDAVGAVSVSSKADVKCAGLNVNCEAQVGFLGKGNASSELSAAGQTVVKGAMVMIN